LTVDLDLQTRLGEDQTCLLCEFGANPFSGSGDISYTNKNPQTDDAKSRTFCSSLGTLGAVKNIYLYRYFVQL